MDRLKQLLVFLTGGGTLDDGWRVCGYSSRDEAVGAMNRVVGSLDRLFTDDASFSRFPADRNIARLVVYVDGASRGNPGPSAVAAVAFLESGELLTSSARRIGRATNNVAEYRAVLEGLQLAEKLRVRDVVMRLDSELVVRQLNGEYRIKNDSLRKLARAVVRETAHFEHCVFEHVSRVKNKEADRLANDALDKIISS